LAQVILAHCADGLAWRLYLEEEYPQPVGDPEDVQKTWLATLSDVTALVTHELNNYLHGIRLHVALLEQEVPATGRSDLKIIRTLSSDAAKTIKQLQQYNRHEPPPLQPINLNAVVRDTLARVQGTGGPVAVHLGLATEGPLALADRRPLDRLLPLLLTNTVAVAAPVQATITVRTKTAGNKVLVEVEDTSPPLPADLLSRLFEPFVVA